MAKFLFWNLNKKPLRDQVVALCHEHRIDVLILAESRISVSDLLGALNKDRSPKFRWPLNLSSRLTFFVRYPKKYLRPVRDDGGVAVRRLLLPIGIDILLVAVHLPSKLFSREVDQTFLSARVAQMIREDEKKVGHSRTIVVGDLNMNPFEDGVVGADGLHSVMDRRIALRRDRIVQGKRSPFFYNPMWSRMGDQSKGPPGTYYFDASGQVNFFWNMFDQVLVRPELLSFFPDEKLVVVSNIGDRSLLSSTGIPDRSFGSDHLPLMFELEIEKGI